MIEDETIWYLGVVLDGYSYKRAKYVDNSSNTLTSSTANANVGLLRYGELMFIDGNIYTWTLTPYNGVYDASWVHIITFNGSLDQYSPGSDEGVRPSLNLKSNVIITSGDGTKNNPFTIDLT